MSDELAPIALFAFRRPLHLRRTVDALASNELAERSKLYVFCDAAQTEIDRPAVDEVRRQVDAIKGFASVQIIHREQNMGLARSIISGVTTILYRHDNVIVLEDDLVTSPSFLQYMNKALRLYASDQRVASIHGYVYPVAEELPETFFLRGADCWGWATWPRAWAKFNPNAEQLNWELERASLAQRFDMDGSYPFTQMLKDFAAGKNDSWAIRWHASAFVENMLTLYPGRSLVENIGLDSSGTHCGNSDKFGGPAEASAVDIETIPIVEHEGARRAFIEYFIRTRPTPELTRGISGAESPAPSRNIKGWLKRLMIKFGLVDPGIQSRDA